MSDTIEPLLVDLVAWIAKEPRDYFETMDAWRTSCPRLPVWEEANARGLVTPTRATDGRAMVCVFGQGQAFLKSRT
ncbi:MAG TPA: hypothetical protein VG309_03440 [Rhizomicrobium sp.]|nr:hypothetical protein [Rhizomicrobium sp.]